jgi:hypothetical protein
MCNSRLTNKHCSPTVPPSPFSHPCRRHRHPQVLYPGTFAPNLDGCQVEMGALGALLEAKQPALYKHLAACGATPALLTTDW